MVAQEGVDSLDPLTHRKLWKAEAASAAAAPIAHGQSAEDLLLPVPPGTIVRDAAGRPRAQGPVPAGEQRGRRPGRPRRQRAISASRSSTNRAPRRPPPAAEGEARNLLLELKVIADVGLIGKPNAGKSTLLSRLSRARPEIAAYPFTTKYPNLGRVQIDVDRSFTLADIPGLIEGAHDGHGLGHEFLRHIQRAGILVHLVEPQPADGTDPATNYRAIRHELEMYDPELCRRPEILVTKADLPEAEAVRTPGRDMGSEVLLISAVTGQGLNKLIGRIAAELAK